jgi:hypothetical protein
MTVESTIAVAAVSALLPVDQEKQRGQNNAKTNFER